MSCGTPQHALGHPGGAAGVEHVQVVGGRFDRWRLRCAGPDDRFVVDGAVHQVVARFVGDLDQHPQFRQLGQNVGDAGRERRVVQQRGGAGVREQVVQLVLHIPVVDVERGDPSTPRAEHPLDVLRPVVGVDAQQVLADLVTGEVRALRLATQPTRVKIGREAVRPLDDLGVGVAAVALDDEVPVPDHGGDGVRGGGDGELCCGVGH